MNLTYKIHNVIPGKRVESATLKSGKVVSAHVDDLRVELVSVDGHGTLTLECNPDQLTDALSMFTVKNEDGSLKPADHEVVISLAVKE